MNNKLVISGIGIILVLIEYLFSPFLNINSMIPDLVLVFLFLISVKSETGFAFMLAFLLGILQDLFNSDLIGISAASNLLALYFVSWISIKELTMTAFVWGLLLMGVVKYTVYYQIIFLQSEYSFLAIVFKFTIAHSIYTLIVGLFIFSLSRNLFKRYFNHV